MTELPEYTVSALGQAIRSTLEGTFGRVRVKGELSSVKRYPSGHIYFSLKDENSVISSVIWRGVAAKISVALE
ncbi:MAG: exodeoxyribonuclease VII large subunit, partial [Pseudomonadota bacterium]|nr:exodeoxyribonuclease VII large subunit [Pseudomonadota bacterium]